MIARHGVKSDGGLVSENNSEIDGLIDEHRDLMTIMGTLRDAVSMSDPDVPEILDQLVTALADHT